MPRLFLLLRPGSRPSASTWEVATIVTSRVTEITTESSADRPTSAASTELSRANTGSGAALGAGPAIWADHVRRLFTDGPEPLEALADVSFGVAPEEIVAIVGPNGSGKSTLLRILGGLLPATNGRVEIGGLEIVAPDPRIGLVFQEPRLLPWRRVRDNVGLPMELAG